jgi:hypothetical protein
MKLAATPILILLLAACRQVEAQAPQPNGGGLRTGVLPRTWQISGPQCAANPQFQIHEYNQDLYIFRESGCSNYEKPFLFLLFGKEKALLLDTGAGKTDVARVIENQVNEWLSRNNHSCPSGSHFWRRAIESLTTHRLSGAEDKCCSSFLWFSELALGGGDL